MTDATDAKGHRYGKKGARRSLIHTMGFRALSQLATFLSYVVLVRGLPEREFGVLSLLYAFIPVVATIASLGLEQTLRRYQPEYLAAGNAAASAWLVRFVASARFATNLVVIGAMLLLWHFVAPLFHLAPYRYEFALFGILLLLHFQARILQLSLASHMLQAYSVGSMAVLPLIKLVSYLTLMATHSFSLQTAIIADTIAYAVAYAFLSIANRRLCRVPPGTGKFRPAREERKRLFRYGLFNNFNDAGVFVLGVQSDNFFIAALMNPVAVGAYSFYARLSDMVNSLSPNRLFDNVIQPLFFAIPRAQAAVRIPRYFTLMLNINVIPQMAALAYAIAYHDAIVTVLFGGKFLDSAALLPVVMGFSLLNIFSVPVTLVAQYAEKASTILLSKITVLYQIPATLLLIPLFGLYGAALATGTATLLKNLFIWWHVRDTARWTNWKAVVGCAIVIWGAAIGICFALRMTLPVPPSIQLILGAVVCVIALLAYIRSPAIAQSDRETLANVLHGREVRVLNWLGLVPRHAASGGRLG
ncbi:MAG: lipopolysaccharide biosynthesis protein [Gammaproteobacteria bacterium]